MYKSAHENFFDFILKSHLNDPKLNLSNDFGSNNANDNDKSFITPKKNSKKIDENKYTLSRSKKKDKKLFIENHLNEDLTSDSSKTTNELLKELAQTLREGQSLQKDVEVLKKVVFDQGSKSGLFQSNLKSFNPSQDQYNYLNIPYFQSNIDSFDNLFNNSNNSTLENKNLNQVMLTQIPSYTRNKIPIINLHNCRSIEKIDQLNLWLIRRIKQIKEIESTIRIIYQQIKTGFVEYVNNGLNFFERISHEVDKLYESNLIQKNELNENKLLINKLSNSLELTKNENCKLIEEKNELLNEKRNLETQSRANYLHIEEENVNLKNSLTSLEEEHKKIMAELERANNQSKELDNFISQLKNIGIPDKISEFNYYVNNMDNKSLNDELVFLKDILKDKRGQEEQLHKNITLLSEENKRLESNLTELRTIIEKKTKENSILQSILECYRIKIGELEEKNIFLQSEVVEFQDKFNKEKNMINDAREKISLLELGIEKHKDEIELKSIDLNNALSRLGQTFVELNETKQKVKEMSIKNNEYDSKLKSLVRENKELNDALSNQFQIIIKKDSELEIAKNNNQQLLKELENEKLVKDKHVQKISELEAINFRIENEKYEINKELKNRYIIEMKKKESLEKITKDYDEIQKELIIKENENADLRKEIELTSNRLKQENIEQINICEREIRGKYENEIINIEEKSKLMKLENKNLLEEVVEQKKMIQELIYEKITLSNEITFLKGTIESDRQHFENSMNKLKNELTAIQEIGDIRNTEKVNNYELVEFLDIYSSRANNNKTPEVDDNILPLELQQILQTTTAPSSNYLPSKGENFEQESIANDFPELKLVNSEKATFFDIEASLSAQCEMAYIDILEQTKRFKDLSEKLKYLEDILRANDQKSVLEIMEENTTELERIGIPSGKLIEKINLSRSKEEVNRELSNLLTHASQCWVSEAEVSRIILEDAHESRNKAAKARIAWIERKDT
ncbi:coiled-coil protein [Cryptosporidium ryanae]|uniref:coiled-coil protein n=1 Tax=Cryptosporidium ryanae TaxID=515981 RepID=UPI00351A9F34|nr:coiled-coil protein [Cryptosporidium ryanae]